MSATAIVQSTGELLELPSDTPEQIMASYKVVNDYITAWQDIKAQLQELARDIVDAKGCYEHDGYQLRVYSTQRMNYDRGVLREVFDPDLLDTFMEPSKGRIDRYLKEHLDEVGEDSTRLRQSMIPVGKPYTVVRLERLERAA